MKSSAELRLLALLLGYALLLGGCAHEAQFAAGIVTCARDNSDDSDVVLRTTSGECILMSGELANELGRIPQANVRVWGRYGTLPARISLEGCGSSANKDVEGAMEAGEQVADVSVRSFSVSRYQIIDAGKGLAPHVGTLRWDFNKIVLSEGPSGQCFILVGDGVGKLKQLIGAKIWVVGPLLGGARIEVLEYGVLRPKG